MEPYIIVRYQRPMVLFHSNEIISFVTCVTCAFSMFYIMSNNNISPAEHGSFPLCHFNMWPVIIGCMYISQFTYDAHQTDHRAMIHNDYDVGEKIFFLNFCWWRISSSSSLALTTHPGKYQEIENIFTLSAKEKWKQPGRHTTHHMFQQRYSAMWLSKYVCNSKFEWTINIWGHWTKEEEEEATREWRNQIKKYTSLTRETRYR